MIKISNVEILLSRSSFIYTGKKIEPEVEVKKSDGELLIIGRDYGLEYTDNINAGTGHVIITGVNDYEGEVILNFEIEKISLETAIISCGEIDPIKKIYDISKLNIKLSIEFPITNNDYNLVTEEYESGDYVYTIVTYTGKGNFKDSCKKTFPTQFNGIIPVDINKLQWNVGNTEFVFSGVEKTISISIKNVENDYTLEKNKDYIVKYSNNLNAGQGTAEVTAISANYTGTKTLDITISPIDISNGSLSCGKQDDEGFYSVDNVTLSVNSRILVLDEDYSVKITYSGVKYSEEEKYYEATIVATGINNYSGEVSNIFKVGRVKLDVSTLGFGLSKYNYLYTGEAFLPNIIVPELEQEPDMETKKELVQDRDYKVELPKEDTIYVGDYYIIITGIGNDYDGVCKLKYTISPTSLNDNENIFIGFGNPDSNNCYTIDGLTVFDGSTLLELYKDYLYLVEEKEIEDGLTRATVLVYGINNYIGSVTKEINTSRKEKYPGKVLNLNMVNIYPRYCSTKPCDVKTGEFYLWDDKMVNHKIRITNNRDGVGKPGFITGWINEEDFIVDEGFAIGDKVLVNGKINTYADGSGNTIIKKNAIMYIVDKLHADQFEFNFAVATAKNRARQGWANEEILIKYKE